MGHRKIQKAITLVMFVRIDEIATLVKIEIKVTDDEDEERKGPVGDNIKFTPLN